MVLLTHCVLWFLLKSVRLCRACRTILYWRVWHYLDMPHMVHARRSNTRVCFCCPCKLSGDDIYRPSIFFPNYLRVLFNSLLSNHVFRANRGLWTLIRQLRAVRHRSVATTCWCSSPPDTWWCSWVWQALLTEQGLHQRSREQSCQKFNQRITRKESWSMTVSHIIY